MASKIDGYRNLMLAVMATQIQDYFNGILKVKLTEIKTGKKKVEAIRYYEANAFHAKEWMRDKDEGYVFSFGSICKYLEIDPEKMRKKILSIETEDRVYEVIQKGIEMKPFGFVLEGVTP